MLSVFCDSDVVPVDLKPSLRKIALECCQFEFDRAARAHIAKFDFVGLIFDEDGDGLVVLPKKCRKDSTNSSSDAQLLFKVLNRLDRMSMLRPLGNDDRQPSESNYPFASFFSIYDYYLKHGIYLSRVLDSRPAAHGKIDWKTTISKSHRLVSKDSLYMYPTYYKVQSAAGSVIADCMAYAINSTARKFGALLGVAPVRGYEKITKIDDAENVIRCLQLAKTQTFVNETRNLIDCLIDFIQKVPLGYGLVLRDCNFDKSWELLVNAYLARHFDGFDACSHRIKLTDKNIGKELKYQKVFRGFNKANLNMAIFIDNYGEDVKKKERYIIDEKYYQDLNTLNYKQLFYTLLLDSSFPDNTAPSIYSCMILPSSEWDFKEHFRPNEQFSQSLADMKSILIMEEYFDVRDLLVDFLS